jgi:hypothetical protein
MKLEPLLKNLVLNKGKVTKPNDESLRIELILGGDSFWIDLEGPFQGVLSYSRPSIQWTLGAIEEALINQG